MHECNSELSIFCQKLSFPIQSRSTQGCVGRTVTSPLPYLPIVMYLCWGMGLLPLISVNDAAKASMQFFLPSLWGLGVMTTYIVQGHVGKGAFSKLEPSHNATEIHTDRKSLKLAIHSTLKSLTSHQSSYHTFTQGHLHVGIRCVCVCVCVLVQISLWGPVENLQSEDIWKSEDILAGPDIQTHFKWAVSGLRLGFRVNLVWH